MEHVQQDYAALRQGAGLLDDATHGLLEIRGADRAAFLHNLLTQEIKRLRPGAGAEAALVTAAAKVLALMTVLANADSHWLLLDRRRAGLVRATLERYHITEDVSLHDRTADWSLIAVQGPASLTALPALFTEPITARQPGDHQLLTLEGIPVRLILQRWTAAPGACLAVPAQHAPACWDRLKARGLAPVGWEALNTCRIEDGLPWDVNDVDETRLLPETGLEARMASETKGCYVGQEVIARMQTYGSASRKLIGMVVESRTVPQPRDAVMADAETIGEVTSACVSPALRRPIALGYLKRPYYQELGRRVEIITQGARQPAALAALPFNTP